MAPLILHNVPEEERYVGEDGLKRPYAIVFPQQEGHTSGPRSRRSIAETGSFGKSTRRSRSRTGTPGRVRENPTLAVADRLFGEWVSSQSAIPASSGNVRRTSTSGNDELAAKDQQSQQQQSQQQQQQQSSASASSQPMEMILRGYRSSVQQYAAIAQYEALAGAVLEDYPRDAPAAQRRYKSDLRDAALTRHTRMTDQERAMVSRAAGGEHWVKVTFASVEAAQAAVYASPQSILGYLVYAEPYRGTPPARDEACPDVEAVDEGTQNGHGRGQHHQSSFGQAAAPANSNMPPMLRSRLLDMSPLGSRTSSQTLDTATVSASQTATVSSATVSEAATPAPQQPDAAFCRRIPTARRAQLLPAEQALLPQQSVVQRVVGGIPLVRWFSGSMIGSEVPRVESGEFDWVRASLYWKFIWWMDATFALFGGDVCSSSHDKEE